MTIQQTTLGGGCFWCLEAAFANLKGVESVVSGYAGGADPAPNYHSVCEGTTGHAEVVQIQYDDTLINFATLLNVFFTIHDPSTANRQGNDIGSQYRSIILYHNSEQQLQAQRHISSLNEEQIWSVDIVTEVVPLIQFYPAEDYHQKYYQQNSRQPYCQAVISPKLAKLQQCHMDLLKQT